MLKLDIKDPASSIALNCFLFHTSTSTGSSLPIFLFDACLMAGAYIQPVFPTALRVRPPASVLALHFFLLDLWQFQ
jgi:hypothetical protein